MNHSLPASSKEVMRARNQRAIFEAIHRHGPVSRVDIASRLNLSPSAVSNITSDLIHRELIYEAREAEAAGVGRRAILLEVAYDRMHVAGIKLSNAGITCALTNLNAEIISTTGRPLATTEPAEVIRGIVGALEELGINGIAALGLSLPGLVDCESSTVRYSPLLGWQQLPIGPWLEDRLGIPVVVENDVNALALAEAWFGYGRDHQSFLVVTLGRGIGLGIILNGEVYRGPSGGAGEFGHILLDPRGPETKYARPGTLEAYLSDEALMRNAQTQRLPLAKNATPDNLVQLAREGYPAAAALYREAGRTLGRALSILVNIFAPTLIILSGEGMRAADFLLPEAEAVLRDSSFGDLGKQVELLVDTWGDDAWARGAAGLAASRYLFEAATRIGGD